ANENLNTSVLLGNGDGTFGAPSTYGVGGSSSAVAVGDFNGDGIPDLAVSNYSSNNVSVLLGNGSGGFGAATNFSVGTYPLSVAVGDFNRDSRQDLVTANQNSHTVSWLVNNCVEPAGTPQRTATVTPTRT